MTDFQSEQLDYDRSGGSNPRPQAQWYADHTTAPSLLKKPLSNYFLEIEITTLDKQMASEKIVSIRRAVNFESM